MQPDKPDAESISASGGDSEESAEAVIVTRLKLKGSSMEPALRAIASRMAHRISKLGRVYTQLPNSDFPTEINVVEEVSVAIIHPLDVSRENAKLEARGFGLLPHEQKLDVGS